MLLVVCNPLIVVYSSKEKSINFQYPLFIKRVYLDYHFSLIIATNGMNIYIYIEIKQPKTIQISNMPGSNVNCWDHK